MKTSALLLGIAFSGLAMSPALAATAAALPKADAAASATAISTITDSRQTGSAAQPRLICRRQGATGSRLGGERICLTKKDWRIVDNGGSVVTSGRTGSSRR